MISFHISVKNDIWNKQNVSHYFTAVKPVYKGHTWDPQKVAVDHRWLLCIGFSIKIGIKINLAGLCLAAVDRWPLFIGGR
jgi:hypothetical protein